MAEPITLTIDGRLVTAEPGQTVLQAAMDAGIYIPYLCYYPLLVCGGIRRIHFANR